MKKIIPKKKMNEKEKVSVNDLFHKYSDEINTLEQPLDAVDYEIKALQLKRRKIEVDIENSSKGVRLVHRILDMMTSLLAEDSHYFVVLNDAFHRQNLLFLSAMHYITTSEKIQVEDDDGFDHLIFEAMDTLSDESKARLIAVGSFRCNVSFTYKSNTFCVNNKDDDHTFELDDCKIHVPKNIKLDGGEPTFNPYCNVIPYNTDVYGWEKEEEDGDFLCNYQTKENTERDGDADGIWDVVQFTVPATCYITPKSTFRKS
jgi:hypothetical protein